MKNALSIFSFDCVCNFCAGFGRGHKQNVSSKRGNTSNASSSRAYNHSQVKHSTKPWSQRDGSFNISRDSKTNRHQTFGLRSDNTGTDHGKMPLLEESKRMLPSYFQPSTGKPLPSSLKSLTSDTRLNSAMDNMGSENHDTYGSHHNAIRILPPTFMHGRNLPLMLPSSSESTFHSTTGEERVTDTDERLIYQAALEVLLATCFLFNLFI